MKKQTLFILIYFINGLLISQTWTLKLESSVELRTLKLTSKSEISEAPLEGATISIYKGTTLVKTVKSAANGKFTIEIPANGNYVLEVSYLNCNTKRFSISTIGVPESIATENYSPSIEIVGGVVMTKALTGIDYSLLKQYLTKIYYFENNNKFDYDASYTDQILSNLSSLRGEETKLIENFTSTNKAADIALNKKDCPLAKTLFEKALTLIPGEQYPINQLLKVDLCLKEKEEAAKKAAELLANKALIEQQAKEKALADKLAKDKELADKATVQKAANEKANADKLAKDKELADKATAQKVADEKANADKLAKDKELADKATVQKAANEKALADKLAKDKELADKATVQKAANEKANADKLAKDKELADKATAQKAANEKGLQVKMAKEKAEKDLAKKAADEKALVDKLAKENSDKEKIDAEKLANEKNNSLQKEPIKTVDNNGIIIKNTQAGNTEMNSQEKGTVNHSIPQVLGANKYKETIIKADGYMKMKRYQEAKVAYEEALTFKGNDIYATNKLTELEKLIIKK